MDKQLKTLEQFERECGSRAELSRITGVPYITLHRWIAHLSVPSRIYRQTFAERFGVELPTGKK